MSQKFIIVVDTDRYAGNFERDSVSFATGLECGLGKETRLAREELSLPVLSWWEAHVLEVEDREGVPRLAHIMPTPGFFNHGLGNHFPSTEEGRRLALEDYKAVATKYERDAIERLENTEPGKGGWTEENIREDLMERKETLEKIASATSVKEHPSYQSVAIYLDQVPAADLLELFERRIKRYLSEQSIEMLGIRLDSVEMDQQPQAPSRPRP